MHFQIDIDTLLEVIEPALRDSDRERLARLVQARWRPRQLSHLLRHADVEARRVAGLTLGLVGDVTVVGAMARALHDEDARVHHLVEEGLWSIWFRSGSVEAMTVFREGVNLLADQQYRDAIGRFEAVTRIDPDFSEAYNQAGICHFFLRSWRQSLLACERTVHVMPVHFGAIAGKGHCLMELDCRDQALECYCQSLRINPRMPGIERAVGQLKLASSMTR